MSAVQEKQDVYFRNFASLEKRLGASDPSWLRAIRKGALERFAELGFPTTRLEDWKYTSVAPIARIPFAPAPPDTGSKRSLPASLGYKDFAASLVFVNGRCVEQLPATDALPSGVRVTSLAAALAGPHAALVEQHLTRYARYDDHAFVALNTAFIEDGAFIEVPKNTALDKPICLLFATTFEDGDRPVVSHPRNLILAGRGSQVVIIEAYAGAQQVYFTNAVTEMVVGEGAVADYCKVQQESENAFHVATLVVEQGRSSSVTTHAFEFGGALDREEVRTELRGEGAESLLHGLYVIGGRQHVDNHTTIDHAQPRCGSRELYKGVLDGASAGVFHGRIIVRKDAQKTDSKQSNKNLLLSENAVINTKPQLEIYADDVKCTHGATIGQIDAEALFYLRSRGIGVQEARALLTEAFASDVIDKVKFASLRESLKVSLLARLKKASAERASDGGLDRVSALEEA